MAIVPTMTRLFVINALVAVIALAGFGYYSFQRYQQEEIAEKADDLEHGIVTMRELLRQKGVLHLERGRLLAGTYVTNGNFEIPDKVQEIFGGVATIFMGDTRVATNVLTDDGTRAVGTKLVGPAYHAVFVEGRPFRGETTILGHPYMTAYDPIRDGRGTVIGALFFGQEKTLFFDRMMQLKVQLAMLLLFFSIAFAIPMTILATITSRMEKANGDHLKFLQTLIDTIPCPIYYKDLAGRYLGCNMAFEHCVGVPRERLVGKVALDLWPKEQADRYQEKDLELLAQPGIQVYEDRIRYVDGSRHDVIFSKGTFEGKDGAPGGLVGVILDISERKRAEDERENAYQQLLDIIEFLPDATFVIDRQQKVIAWNRAIETMTGIAKEEILGKGDYEYALPFYGVRRPILIDLFNKDRETLNSRYERIEKHGKTLAVEVRLEGKDGQPERYLWTIACPLFDKDGHQAGAIQTIRDITERRQAERENVRLEAQLHHSRLMEAVMVQLGHDLKTPLTSLCVLLPLIQEELITVEAKRMGGICSRNIEQIVTLSEKTMKLAMLATMGNGAGGTMTAIPLSVLVDHCLTERTAPGNGTPAVNNGIDGQIRVLGSADQLRELFHQLLDNAARFSADQGAIDIGADERDGTVTVWVRDQGAGIEPHHLARIFDDFYKADQSRHDVTMSGLGLTICKKIVLNHNGTIWADSPGPGKGTTVSLTLQSAEA